MVTARALAGRITLSAAVAAGFLVLLSVAPSFEAPVPATPALPAPAATVLPAPAGLVLNGIDLLHEVIPVADCEVATWKPASAGLCAGGCAGLSEHREEDVATFAWSEENAGLLHALRLDCSADGSGQASHLALPASVGAGGFGPPSGPRRPRTEPVPFLPGAETVTDLRSGALTLFIDRPRSPSTALDAMQLELVTRGWRAAGGPRLRPAPEAATTRVFTRGPELCVVTLESGSDDEDPLLIIAYSHSGPAWEPQI